MNVRRITAGPDDLKSSLGDLWEARSLLRAVAWREFRVRYKQSLLGVAWAVAHPLALMLIFTLVFGRIVRVDSEGLPYPLFAYAALLPWTFFSTGTTLAVMSLVKHVELITKVRFPREILPLASVAASLVDFAIAMALFFVLALGFGYTPPLAILYLPGLVAIQLVLTTGVAAFFAALNVRYRDVKYIVPLMLQVWLYASPVIYSLDAVPASARNWYLLNPMAGIADGYRRVLLHGRAPDGYALAVAALVSLLIFWLGWRYFRRVENHFADVI